MLYKLVAKGMPVDSVESARAWREANLNPRKERRAVGALGEETARHKAAQADLAEMEAAEKRAELIDVEEVLYLIGAAMAVLRGLLEGQPGRNAAQLAVMTDQAEIRHFLRDDNRRILEAISQKFAELAVLAAQRTDGPAS